MKVKFSIRYKFLAVTTLLLLSCVTLYLLLASTIFSRDKTELVFDLNKSTVHNIRSEMEAVFSSVSDKLELFALISQSKLKVKKEFHRILDNDDTIVYVHSTNSNKFQKTSEYSQKKFLQTYGLEKKYFKETLPGIRPVPMDEIKTNGLAYWNATVDGGPFLVGVGRSVVQEDARGVAVSQFAVISYVRMDRVAKMINELRTNEVSIVSDQGQVIVGYGAKDAKPWELFSLAQKNPLNLGVLEYQDQQGKKMLGGFSKSTKNRFYVLSRVASDKVFAVVENLVYRSIVFGLIIVTLTFIAAILFSRSITRPLDTLVDGMKEVSGGTLSKHIELRTVDETAVLASSFNRMIDDLKESRDQLEEINRDLEQKVKDRTKMLEEQNRAVKQAQEALLKTTRLASVGEIAGRAAHEILNPLTSIMTRIKKVSDKIEGNAVTDIQFLAEIQSSWENDFKSGGFEKLIEEWQKPSEVNRDSNLWNEDMSHLKEVNKNVVDQLTSLTSDMKFLLSESQRISKIVQSMRSLSIVKGNKAKYSAHKLLHESVNIMGDLFAQNDVEVVEWYEAKQDEIVVDRDEFIQSLTNLLRNSLQAVQEIDREGYKPKIGLLTRIEEGELIIEVVDNGTGIEPEHRNKLFETQFSTKDREEGTGLGLSISRRFIRAYGGDIKFMGDNDNWNAVFRITLPAKEVERPMEAAA